MAQAKSGDTVRVHYEGFLDDGTPFDSSGDGDPLEFTIGNEEVIPGFENAVVGMEAGDSRRVTVESAEAYGGRDEDLTAVVDRADFPDDLEPTVGMMLRLSDDRGEEMDVTVTDVGEETVTIDANHPLAGRNLTFQIQLVQILHRSTSDSP